MVAAYEVMVATTAVRNLIKEGKPHQLRNSLVTGSKDGMITLEPVTDSHLVQTGVITYDDAVMRSLYPKDIESCARDSVRSAWRRCVCGPRCRCRGAPSTFAT